MEFLLYLMEFLCRPLPYNLPPGSSARTLRRDRRPSYILTVHFLFISFLSYLKFLKCNMICITFQKFNKIWRFFYFYHIVYHIIQYWKNLCIHIFYFQVTLACFVSLVNLFIFAGLEKYYIINTIKKTYNREGEWWDVVNLWGLGST